MLPYNARQKILGTVMNFFLSHHHLQSLVQTLRAPCCTPGHYFLNMHSS